jgi:hypothetical protein
VINGLSSFLILAQQDIAAAVREANDLSVETGHHVAEKGVLVWGSYLVALPRRCSSCRSSG